MPYRDPQTGLEYPDALVENRSEDALAKEVAADRGVAEVVGSLEEV